METKNSSINKEQVAHITEWHNNCVVSTVAVFLVDAFLNKKLSQEATNRLVKSFNEYYDTHFSEENLHGLFQIFFKMPIEREFLVGQVLLQILGQKKIIKDEGGLSKEAFARLGLFFQFNVSFYGDSKQSNENSLSRIQELSLPFIYIGDHGARSQLTLRTYFQQHQLGAHFDLIMDDAESAKIHNRQEFETTNFDLPTDEKNERVIREKTIKILQMYDTKPSEVSTNRFELFKGFEEKKKEKKYAKPQLKDKLMQFSTLCLELSEKIPSENAGAFMSKFADFFRKLNAKEITKASEVNNFKLYINELAKKAQLSSDQKVAKLLTLLDDISTIIEPIKEKNIEKKPPQEVPLMRNMTHQKN